MKKLGTPITDWLEKHGNPEITKQVLKEAMEFVSIPVGLKSEGGNLVYRSEPGEKRGIFFMQKDTPENRERFNKLFQDEVARQFIDIQVKDLLQEEFKEQWFKK